ncbi:hypothetical protein BGZ83_001931 [Gryganskiella cystojenkinii]|nr:hypothetical protein BGZ83_001931 [Gryganskiella cystojenkinii]
MATPRYRQPGESQEPPLLHGQTQPMHPYLQQRLQVHSSDPRDSDADASSDFSILSELEQHQNLIFGNNNTSNNSNSNNNSNDHTYSDYEVPLSGRWDMASHWQLADYSEGVEGDADDDDDEEEHGFDTDLSEGGPATAATTAATSTVGRPRRPIPGTNRVHSNTTQLDLGRVRDIMSSSPSSTPIILSGLSTLTNSNTGNSFALTGNGGGQRDTGGGEGGSDAERGRGREGDDGPIPGGENSSVTDVNLQEYAMDSQSSTTTDDRSHRHGHGHPYHPHHPYRSGGASERTVRFTRMSGRSLVSPEPALSRQDRPQRFEDSYTRAHSREDSDGYRTTLDSIIGDTPPASTSMITTTTTTGEARDNGHASSSPSAPFPYRLNNRTSSRSWSQQAPQAQVNFSSVGQSRSTERRHALAYSHSSLSPRHAYAGSSRSSSLTFNWGPPVRHSHHQQNPSSSSVSSVASSPVTSEASSRVASPILNAQQTVIEAFKPLDEEDREVEDQQSTENGHQSVSEERPPGITDTLQDTLMTETEQHSPTTQPPPHHLQHHHQQQQQQQQPQRRSVSTSITSLPSFANSVFVPRSYLHNIGYRDPWAPSSLGSLDGQKFSGSQSLKVQSSTLIGLRMGDTEEWVVKVTISAVDQESGTVCGLMEALDVPMSASQVVTFWEGEIIDFENHTLWTKKWSARSKTDLEHWRRLEAFQGMDEKVIIKGAKSGKFPGHISQKYIFMRWKEKNFVNVSEHTAGLTIAGFYYISMRRSDGYVEGYYYDRQSTPFQHLSILPVFDSGGFSSSIFEVA